MKYTLHVYGDLTPEQIGKGVEIAVALANRTPRDKQATWSHHCNSPLGPVRLIVHVAPIKTGWRLNIQGPTGRQQ